MIPPQWLQLWPMNGIGHEQVIEDLTSMVEDDDTVKNFQELSAQNARLELLICEHQKRFWQPKVMILDPKAALAILDLEMLCCFNNWHHELQVKAQKQCEKNHQCPTKTVCHAQSQNCSHQTINASSQGHHMRLQQRAIPRLLTSKNGHMSPVNW